MSKKIFKPGDIFKFKNKEYMVIQNYGTTGLVKEYEGNGIIIKGFSWDQEDEPCVYIRTEKNDLETIESITKEYENFFEKYKL